MSMATGPRSLKEKQRQEREELILRAAEEVLAEKGYHETSIDEIAARVGIAKGTVYLHFASKEELVFALFARDARNLTERVATIAASPGTPSARLQAVLEFIYGGMFSQRYRLLGSIYQDRELLNKWAEKKEQMHTLWDGVAAQVSALLDAGKAAGEVDQTLPTPVMLSTFFNLLSHRGYERLVLEGKMPFDELVKHLSHFYFNGIAAR